MAWYKLYLKISNYCLIANNIRVNDNFERSFHRYQPEANLESVDRPDQETVPESETTRESNRVLELLNPHSIDMPVNFYKFENMITLSSLVRRLDETSSKNLYAALSCSSNETTDTFISDLVWCCFILYFKNFKNKIF